MGRWIRCRIGDHDWTCAAEQGITPDELPEVQKLFAAGDMVGGFHVYATMYCRACGKVHATRAR